MLTRKQIARLRASRVPEPNKVKKAIELAGVTQVQVAAAIEMTQSHVSEIANGNYSRLPNDTARAIAEYFGCAIEDLFPAREAVAS